MPLPISDRRLSQLYKKLEDSNGTIDQTEALKMLAEVGDSAGWSPNKVLSKLNDSSLSRDDKIALVKKGMTSSEQRDLTKILDQGTVKLDDTAKSFFQAVLGRTPTPTPTPAPTTTPTTTPTTAPSKSPVTLTGTQADGLAGTAKPGDKIEAINLSAAPTGRLDVTDTTVVATAGADGTFKGGKLTGDQAMKEGDLIRIRARHADGTASDWMTIKARGIESADSREAQVAMFRIGLADAGGGKISVTNINDGRQISEPGAKLQLTNVRTSEKTLVTLDDDGTFPKDLTLNGKAGDQFTVAATDGTINADFKTTTGKLMVPGGDGGTTDLIKDPALHKDELDANGKPKFSKERFTGPLFIDGVKPTDVAQGQLGDCYVPSAFAALAVQNPDAIQNMIKDNGDGTYTVTFKERGSDMKYRDVPIKVDGDLYVRSYGGPLYGSANSPDRSPKTMEMWFPLVEKAYATWKGSYNDIGNGGQSDEIFQSVLGRDGQEMSIDEDNGDEVFAQIKKAFDAKQPLSAGTYGDSEQARYTNTGVYADHSYSIMGYSEENGQKYVDLRNPWGESEPAGNGANDGIFKLPLKDFTKLYQTLMYTNP